MLPLKCSYFPKRAYASEASFQRSTPKLPMAINYLINNNCEEGEIFQVNYKAFWNFSKKIHSLFSAKNTSAIAIEKQKTSLKNFYWNSDLPLWLVTKKMFSWKKKNYREPDMVENIQWSYQGFNSCKRLLVPYLSFAQSVSFLLTLFILLFVLPFCSLI